MEQLSGAPPERGYLEQCPVRLSRGFRAVIDRLTVTRERDSPEADLARLDQLDRASAADLTKPEALASAKRFDVRRVTAVARDDGVDHWCRWP